MRSLGMRVSVLTAFLLAGCTAHGLRAADERTLALETAAQTAFRRVALHSLPGFEEATECAQAQSMAASVAAPEKLAKLLFQKGFCELAAAASSDNRASFDEAAETFDTAIADAQGMSARQKIPGRVSPDWSAWASIARIESGASMESQETALARAVDAEPDPACQSDAEMTGICRAAQQLGNAWLGRIALARGDMTVAERRFTASNSGGGVPQWNRWIAGLEAFRRVDYPRAAGEEGAAIAAWRGRKPSTLVEALAPRPEWPAALAEYGGSQFAAGDAKAALETLDQALKSDAANAKAYYLKAASEEKLGRGDAVSDYDAAARAALAAGDSAGAHFYRGIVFFRRKELQRAESEFAAALNGSPDASWAVDARAWRHLTAVAGGACGASRDFLDRTFPAASPFFPKEEARKAVAGCATVAARQAAVR